MKTIFSLSVITFLLIFTSCKKCQECTTVTSQDYGSYVQETSSSQEYCGDDYDNAPEEGVFYQTAGGANQEVTITCVDK